MTGQNDGCRCRDDGCRRTECGTRTAVVAGWTGRRWRRVTHTRPVSRGVMSVRPSVPVSARVGCDTFLRLSGLSRRPSIKSMRYRSKLGRDSRQADAGLPDRSSQPADLHPPSCSGPGTTRNQNQEPGPGTKSIPVQLHKNPRTTRNQELGACTQHIRQPGTGNQGSAPDELQCIRNQ